MSRIRVGVPPGVGDVAWCLTKLRSIAAGRTVTLCVCGSHFERAVEWAGMTDLADQAEIVWFKPREAEKTGIRPGQSQGMDLILWPNAVIDRGERIETWLPEYECDLSFKIACDPPPEVAPVVVFASSIATSHHWFGGQGEHFWNQTIACLNEEHGPVALIGKEWDLDLGAVLQGDIVNLLGRTSLRQLAGLLAQARVVVGVISGVTILANFLRTPAVALWPDHKFPQSFPNAWVPPDARYAPMALSEATPRRLAYAARAVAR